MILPVFGWRDLFLTIAAVTMLVLLVLLAFLPESPRFLVRNPETHGRLRRILDRLKVNVHPDAQLIDSRSIVKGRTSLAVLFGSGALLNTLGLWAAFFFCMMANYGSLSWIPTVLASRGYSLGVTSTTLSMYGFGGIFGSLLCARLVEILGSRMTMTLLAVLGAAVAITLSVLHLNPQDSVMPLAVSVMVLGLAIGGLIGCLYSLAAYTYPPAVKATGIGAASSVGRVGGIISSYVAAVAMSFGGSSGFFQFVGASALFLLAFVWLVRTHIPREREINR
jgi:AAHS family 4-hydroxybenzoate transporter-like MFS transporter